jgi:hypothetical protein
MKYKFKVNKRFERKRCRKPPYKCKEIFERKSRVKVSEVKENEELQRVKKARKKKILIKNMHLKINVRKQ